MASLASLQTFAKLAPCSLLQSFYLASKQPPQLFCAEELGFGVRQIQPASNPFAGASIAVRPRPLEILKETQ